MHELIKKILEKQKELEEYLFSQVGNHISFSQEHIHLLVEAGKLPKEVGDWFIKNHEKERFGKVCDNVIFRDQLLICLLHHRHLICQDIIPSNHGAVLFENVNIDEEFGIANCISNSLYHLEELLKNMEITKLYESTYEAKSSIKNAKGEAISLSYSFQSCSSEEAETLLKNYKTTMMTKGLKVWLAYWLMANKLGRVEYSCHMIEIMKLISDDNREAFFSVKEKEEHWALTKMLEMSKLSRERKIKKRGTGTEIIQWIEQPLVEILGGEREMLKEDKYPTAIVARVLMPRMETKGFAPSLYKNTTLSLSPSDLFLAFKFQTRASQKKQDNLDIHVDWDFIFEAGNLKTTAA